MKYLIILTSLLITSSFAQADMVSESTTSFGDNVVFDDAWLPQVGENEPFFGNRMFERDIASYKPQIKEDSVDWQGQLSVLKEIPYSYPQLSRRTLAAKVLVELEASGK